MWSGVCMYAWLCWGRQTSALRSEASSQQVHFYHLHVSRARWVPGFVVVKQWVCISFVIQPSSYRQVHLCYTGQKAPTDTRPIHSQVRRPCSPRHSTLGSPQKSSWHSLQVRPPKPGMQWHCPVNWGQRQTCVRSAARPGDLTACPRRPRAWPDQEQGTSPRLWVPRAPGWHLLIAPLQVGLGRPRAGSLLLTCFLTRILIRNSQAWTTRDCVTHRSVCVRE